MDAREQAFLLREIDQWASDGTLTAGQAAALRARYLAAPVTPTTPPDGARIGAAGEAAAGARRGEGAANASDWLQLVGGLLVGAGLVAFVLFLDLHESARAYVLMGLGVVAFAGGAFLTMRAAPERRGLSDAMLAASLVALGVAAPMASANVDDRVPASVALLAGIVAFWLRKGASAIVVIGLVAFGLGSFVVTRPTENQNATSLVWWGVLLAYGAFMMLWRDEAWANVALAVLVAPLVGAQFLSLEFLGVRDSIATELWIGAQLAALVAAGAFLGARGLVAGAAAGLTIDAVTFSFDVGGPLTALVLLLALGGLLVWQAEFVRGYFRKRAAPPS